MKPFWTVRRQALAWSGLGALALLYLLALVYVPQFRGADEESLGRPPVSPLADAARRLADSKSTDRVAILRNEIDVLRRQLSQVQERNQRLGRRLRQIEDAVGPTTSSLPPRREPTEITSSLREENRHSTPVPEVSVRYLPLPGDGFGDEGLDGSPLPTAGEIVPTRTLFGVELAQATSADALKKEWAALSSRHGSLLGRLEVRQQKGDPGRGDEGESGLRLIAGPFPNAAGAALLCARLRAAGTPCKETVFTGEGLW